MYELGTTRAEIQFWKAREATIISNKAFIPYVCPKLEQSKCKIYLHKPLGCSLFKVGGEICKLCRKLEHYED